MALKRIGTITSWILLLLMIVSWTGTGRAEIKFFDLTNPYLRKIPMAVPVFQAATPSRAESEQAVLAADKLKDMLEFTGYF
jgi:TolB protein